MSQIRKVRNHHGELETFERDKIVASILSAIRTAGRSDEWIADKLAPMIELALAKRFEEQPPSLDDVAYCVEQSLRGIEDLYDVAEAYVANRTRKRRLHELEDEAPAAGSSPAGPNVTPLARGELLGWDRSRIEAALVREENLAVNQARAVAAAVESKVLRMGLASVTTGLIRELVDIELIERNLRSPTLAPSQVSVPLYDIGQAIFPVGDEPSAGWIDSPQAMRRFAAESVLSQYTLSSVHSEAVRTAHLTGLLTLEHTENPASVHGITLNCARLATRGAGLGFDQFFPREASSVADMLDRLTQLVAELSAMTAASLELLHLDTAFAPIVHNAAEASDMASALLERIAVSAGGTHVRLVFDAIGGSVDSPGSLPLARAMLDVLGDGSRRSRMAVELVLVVGPATAGDPQGYTLLERAAWRALAEGTVSFRFTGARLARGRRSLFDSGNDEPLPALTAIPSVVTLNLVSPVLSGSVRDSAAYFAAIDGPVKLAVQALTERASFIDRFYSRRRTVQPGLGPQLGRLLAANALPSRVSLIGLMNVARIVSGGVQSQTTADLLRMAQAITSYLHFKLLEYGATTGVDVRLSGDAPREAARRAVTSDRRLRAAACEQVLGTAVTLYACGFAMLSENDSPEDWQTRLEAEAGLHPLAATASLWLGSEASRVPPGNLVQFLVRVASSPSIPAHALRVDVPMRQCASCGNMAPAATSVCPACSANQWAIPHGQRTLFAAGPAVVPDHPPGTKSSYTVM